MAMKHIKQTEFTSKPWKNGLGTTYDIALLPAVADHSNFNLRFALSPIIDENLFSAFPGIERVITLIEGNHLSLKFDDDVKTLALHESLQFDSALTPMGNPGDEPVKVINVMARQNQWNIVSCGVSEQIQYDVGAGDYLFFFAIDACMIRTADAELLLGKQDAVLINDANQVSILSADKTKILHAYISPA